MGLGRSVAELQEAISSREFAEWMAYYDLEPWGERRADLRMGRICATMAGTFAGIKAKPADFMPDFDAKPVERESQTVLKAKLRMLLKPHMKGKGGARGK